VVLTGRKMGHIRKVREIGDWRSLEERQFRARGVSIGNKASSTVPLYTESLKNLGELTRCSPPNANSPASPNVPIHALAFDEIDMRHGVYQVQLRSVPTAATKKDRPATLGGIGGRRLSERIDGHRSQLQGVQSGRIERGDVGDVGDVNDVGRACRFCHRPRGLDPAMSFANP